MKPITVTTTVARPVEEVYDHLAVIGNHEAFTDHMLVDWTVSGPAAGVGAVADVYSTLGRREPVRFEVIEAERPARILERNTAAKGKRVGLGEFTLAPDGPASTRVTFTFTLQSAPWYERPLLPLLRPKLVKANERSMQRMGEQLAP